MARQTQHGPTGVRLNQKQDIRCRSAIQTTALLHRLNDFALQKPCRYSGQMFQMTDTQVRAALGLLRKTIPDLAVTELRGDPDRPVAIEFTWAPAAQAVSHETNAPPVIDATPEPVIDATEFVWGKSDAAKD
jgi:hypothetical protein